MKLFVQYMVFALVCCMSTSGSATDSKVHYGFDCVPFDDTMSWDFTAEMGFINTTPNASTQRTVVCPVVRDYIATQPNEFLVRVRDDHNSLSISCHVEHCDDTTLNSCSTGASDASTGTTGALEPLDLPLPSTDFDDGPYVIVCIVPDAPSAGEESSIHSYLVNEN